MARDRQARPASSELSDGRVVRFFELEPDATIVRAVAEGKAAGAAALFDRYHEHVRRVLLHELGPDGEIADLVQEVFLTAMASIGRLTDPDALRGWLGSIAAFTARARLRQRTRGRIFQLLPTDELPELEHEPAPPEIDEALRAAYRVLTRMPAAERIVFSLRVIEGMELPAIARHSEVSLSTIKRRLNKAEARFSAIAGREPALVEWLLGGPR